MRTLLAMLVGALLLLAPACGGGDDSSATPAGTTTAGDEVTIETDADFSGESVRGTFEVTEGADVLGCSTGTFEDTPVTDGIHKEFACEDGSKTGTFTAWFDPEQGGGSGDQSGPWRIEAATGDFRGLRGGGDFSVVYDDTSEKGVETLTGEIRYP